MAIVHEIATKQVDLRYQITLLIPSPATDWTPRVTDLQSHTDATIPDVRPRPAFDRYLRDRSIDNVEAARLFGCSRGMIGFMRAPFDDPLWKPPGPKLMHRIIKLTRGGVRPEDFHPPAEMIVRGRAA